jgi:hypothetical protein
MASLLLSPEFSHNLSMPLLDLDCDTSPVLIEPVSTCSDKMAYNQMPMGRAGAEASQQGAPVGHWRQGPDYGRHQFYAAPEMGPPAYPSGPAFLPPAPAPPVSLPPIRQPIAQIQSFSQQPFIPERQLGQSYSYAIDRGDGTFTRLIPADRLPPMYGLAQSQDREGLIVLPRPRAVSPHSRHAGLADVSFSLEKFIVTKLAKPSLSPVLLRVQPRLVRGVRRNPPSKTLLWYV